MDGYTLSTFRTFGCRIGTFPIAADSRSRTRPGGAQHLPGYFFCADHMNTELHKCRDCDRMIPAHVPCCIYCKSNYKKNGICWYCGTRPVKPREGRKPQSQYCRECQRLSKNLFDKRDFVRDLTWRGSESKGRKLRSVQQMAHLPDEDD